MLGMLINQYNAMKIKKLIQKVENRINQKLNGLKFWKTNFFFIGLNFRFDFQNRSYPIQI